nr:MAG TPA: hypothetical protein [Crassvirales sp.]
MNKLFLIYTCFISIKRIIFPNNYKWIYKSGTIKISSFIYVCLHCVHI